MPALCFSTKYFSFSYSFDALTLYPTFEYYSQPGLRNCLEAALTSCGNLKFVIKTLKAQEPTDENKSLINTLNHFKTEAYYDRFILKTDDDHDLYHKDAFKREQSHWHIKFKDALCVQQLAQILQVFCENDLLTIKDKFMFLCRVDDRYNFWEISLLEKIQKDKYSDTKMLLTFITKVYENDVLVHLHKFLLSSHFDYLRSKDPDDILWQGTNKDGKVVLTAKSWAFIEKSIATQMAINIKQGCTRFTPAVGAERAKQFSRLPFWRIKRKALSENVETKLVQSLVAANDEQLQAMQTKILSKL